MSREELCGELGPRAFSELNRSEVVIYIENVFDPSLAHVEGIRPGDSHISFDRHLVHTSIEFQKFPYLAGIGNQVEVGIFR